MSKKTPIIIAHRGASVDYYQNTMKSFGEAIKQKADMIELDTHLTKDGYFIVHHDASIKTEGLEYIISQTNLETIQSLSLPSNDKIPLLSEVLENYLEKIMFNIEIKCQVTQKEFDTLLTEIGADTKRIVVSSFLSDVMYSLKETQQEYRLAFLYIFPAFLGKRMARKEHIAAINPYFRLLSKATVRYYHKLGKKVFPWTINEEKDIQKLVRKEVDGIITDRPANTRKIIADYIKMQ